MCSADATIAMFAILLTITYAGAILKGAEKLNYYILFPSMLFLNSAALKPKSIAQILLVVGLLWL